MVGLLVVLELIVVAAWAAARAEVKREARDDVGLDEWLDALRWSA